MKLFQIEEPDGTPADRDAPGVAVGIDLAGAAARVAIAVGGNAEILPDADGSRALAASVENLVDLLLSLRARAEKQLARPVTHAVIACDADEAEVERAASLAGLAVLRLMKRREAALLAKGADDDEAPVLGAAQMAEELAPPAA